MLDLTDVDGRPARWTLILGDNGVGKTTLLQCLAWMQPVREQGPFKFGTYGSDEFHILGSAITDENEPVIDSLVRMKSTHVTLDAGVSLGVGLSPTGRFDRAPKGGVRTGVGVRLTFDKQGHLTEAEPTRVRKSITELEKPGVDFVKPLVVLYGASPAPRRAKLKKA